MFSQQQQTHVFMEEQQSYWKSAEWRGLKLLINAKWWRSRVIACEPPLFNSRKYKINTRYIHKKRTSWFCPLGFLAQSKINFRTLRGLFKIIQFTCLYNVWTDSICGTLKNCHKCNYCGKFKAQDQERFM